MVRSRSTIAVALLFPAFVAGGLGCGGDDGVAPEKVLESLAVSGLPDQLAAGLTAQLAAEGAFNDGSTESLTGDVTWTSDDEAVATVDATGLLTAESEGPATITASMDGVSGTGAVTVTAAELQSASVTPAEPEIRVTDQLQMTARATFSDGSTSDLSPGSLTWSATGGGAVTISAEGLVTGEAVGTSTVQAEHTDGIVADTEVSVRAFADEGSASEPLSPETLPYRGEVGDGNSYYRLDGLTPGEAYTIHVTDIYEAVRVYGYTEGFSGVQCRQIPATEDDISCPLPANSEGEVYLSVTSDQTGGSIYSVEIEPGGLVSEGTRDEPADITGALPYDGTVSTGDSYYVVTGLSPASAYTVEVTDPSGDVTLVADSAWSTQGDTNPCTSREPDTSDEACAALTSSSGELHIRVAGGNTDAGATFTVDLTSGGLVSEGSRLDPKDVTGSLPYAGQVGLDWSYYAVTGLVPGDTYTVNLTDVTDEVTLHVYSEAGHGTDAFECRSANFGATASESCAGVAVNGALYIDVSGYDSEEGATFTVDVATGGIPKEGYYGDPVDLTGALPHDGSVNGDISYYQVTGLAAESEVTVTLTGLTDNAELWVYGTPDYTDTPCSSSELGTADESCTFTTNASGEIHIRVTSAFGVVGAYYTLDVE